MAIGPIILFDKSFIQSLSTDEAVWLDHFFISNICPLFYVETLADLSKERTGTRSPENIVSSIADKVPELHGSPCVYHAEICKANLYGHKIPLNARIPLAGGRPVRSNNHSGVVFSQSDEAKAFQRWQRQQFEDKERDFASKWRESLRLTDLKNFTEKLRILGLTSEQVRSLDGAAELAKRIIDQGNKDFLKIDYLCGFLGLSKKEKEEVMARWRRGGCKPLRAYAPYAAHVLEVEIFFQLALKSSLISADRPSNRIDIAYLYYLPFAHFFVSSDKLHRATTHALAGSSKFVWGEDLKGDLRAINDAYRAVDEVEREKGLSVFAPHPPETQKSVVRSLWDAFIPGWDRPKRAMDEMSPEASAALMHKLEELPRAPSAKGSDAAQIIRDPSSITIERYVRAKRGSWWQIPKSVADKQK
jgi:hypothetical protein